MRLPARVQVTRRSDVLGRYWLASYPAPFPSGNHRTISRYARTRRGAVRRLRRAIRNHRTVS